MEPKATGSTKALLNIMRYRLRTLLIVLAIGPALLAGAWWVIDAPPGQDRVGEAFLGLMVWGVIMLAIGGILVEEHASRQQKSRDKRKSN